MPTYSDKTVSPSRFFVETNIPRPQQVESNFVYNYFVPDEAADEDLSIDSTSPEFSSYLNEDTLGNPYTFDSDGKKLVYVNGKLSTADVLNRISPRFVEISWLHSTSIPSKTLEATDLEQLYNDGKIIEEESISSVYDTSIRGFDPTLRDRITTKLSAYQKIGMPQTAASWSKTTAISQIRQTNSDIGATTKKLSEPLEALVDYNAPDETKRVNDLGRDVTVPEFQLAVSMILDASYDRRLLPAAVNSYAFKNYSTSRKLDVYTNVTDSDARSKLPKEPIQVSFLDSESQQISDVRIETPYLEASIFSGTPPDFKFLNQISKVGYIIERFEAGEEIFAENPSKIFFSNTPINTNFIDNSVRYGRAYYYTIRTVYERIYKDEAFDASGVSLGLKTLIHYISSKPSLATYVETKETIPPLPPDGIFFKFNYNAKRGLIMSWQYPVGKSRDTKYFQIFRRKTIFEPFTCIAELDFNDAIVKSTRREKVNEERVFKFSGTRTVFEDTEFDRDSSYIYAIASVDAHGLTSGYSAQSRVTFNRPNNAIDLKFVSREGAPKQYPNFYVDPEEDETLSSFSLTQDLITSSGKQRVHIYLDTDCEVYRKHNGQSAASGSHEEYTHTATRLPGATEGPVYKMHFINLDRQKDDSIEIRITDFRDTE